MEYTMRIERMDATADGKSRVHLQVVSADGKDLTTFDGGGYMVLGALDNYYRLNQLYTVTLTQVTTQKEQTP